jgi:hypothetical protein
MSFHSKGSLDERGEDGDDRKPDAFLVECDRDDRVAPAYSNDSIVSAPNIVSEDTATAATTRMDRRPSANLNSMDPEDWLIKNQESIGQTAHRLIPPARIKSGDEPDYEALEYATECDETSIDHKNSADDLEYPTTIPSGYPRTAQTSETQTNSKSESLPTVSRRHDVECGDEEMMTAHVEFVQTLTEHSTPGLQSRSTRLSCHSCEGSLVEDILVVQGERTQEAKNRRALIHVTSAVFVVLAIVAGVVFNFSRKTHEATATALNNMTAPSPIVFPVQEFPNMTIADGLVWANNEHPSNSLLTIPIADVFIDILRQTDRNMTVLGLSEDAIGQFMNNFQILKMAIQPTYSGHTVSYMCTEFTTE